MPSIVLSGICLAAALLLSVINMFTSAKILQNQADKANQAFTEVLPGATGKTQITLDDSYPEVITEAYKFDNGFVFRTEVTGYKSGLVIMCGIDLEGKVVGVKHIQSSETYGMEPELNKAYVGDTLDTVELILASGATPKSKTSTAYYNAIKASLQGYAIANGATVDTRSPEQILQDNCNAALGTEGKTFTAFFSSYSAFGEAKVYVCDAGAVINIGETFVGYQNGSDTPVSGGTAETEAAYAAYSSLEKIDLSAFTGIGNSVKSVYKNASGEYMFSLSRKGFEWAEAPMEIELFINSEGVITSCVTVSHSESGGYGAIVGSSKYYEQYVGKTAETYTEVPAITPDNYPNDNIVSGATMTTNGYKTAIAHAFSAFGKITEGGNQ